jgi:heat-inducible transcriptional repressor
LLSFSHLCYDSYIKQWQGHLKPRKLSKQEKEKAILFGMVELFIKTNKPIGSNFLKEKGFEFLSSATIRNYFAKMEKEGLLMQHHFSGGRIPTDLAYKEYAYHCLKNPISLDQEEEGFLKEKLEKETKEIATYLNQAAETIAELTNCLTFISTVRFDNDFIENIKIVALDNSRILCAILTDFGQIHTEILYLSHELDKQELETIENFFMWRLSKGKKPHFKSEVLMKIAQRIYHEIIMRHVINFLSLDIYKAGFSKLLTYPEFKNPTLLTGSIALFENQANLLDILKQAIDHNNTSMYIGRDLKSFNMQDASILIIPYYLNLIPVGAIAILGPLRIPYNHLLSVLKKASSSISKTITKSAYKFKISMKPYSTILLSSDQSPLLEDKRRHHVKK